MKLLFLLKLVYVSCGLLLSGLFGPVASLLPILVRCSVCWMVRLDGPTGCDPAFCVVYFQFRMLRRFLAYRPNEVAKLYQLLVLVVAGHGPAHLLVGSADEIGFVWSPEMVEWVRKGLPVLSNLAGPIQHLRTAVLEGWRGKVSAVLCAGKGFRGGSLVGCKWYIAAP